MHLFNMCATSLKNVNLIIIFLSLTDWANLSNDLLFFGFLFGDNAMKCLIMATISGQVKIAFSAVSSFSTHCVPQKRCGNFPEMLLFRSMSIRAGKSERIFHIAFLTSLTFKSLALTPAFRDPDTICKLQPHQVLVHHFLPLLQ